MKHKYLFLHDVIIFNAVVKIRLNSIPIYYALVLFYIAQEENFKLMEKEF